MLDEIVKASRLEIAIQFMMNYSSNLLQIVHNRKMFSHESFPESLRNKNGNVDIFGGYVELKIKQFKHGLTTLVESAVKCFMLLSNKAGVNIFIKAFSESMLGKNCLITMQRPLFQSKLKLRLLPQCVTLLVFILKLSKTQRM